MMTGRLEYSRCKSTISHTRMSINADLVFVAWRAPRCPTKARCSGGECCAV